MKCEFDCPDLATTTDSYQSHCDDDDDEYLKSSSQPVRARRTCDCLGAHLSKLAQIVKCTILSKMLISAVAYDLH